MAITEWSDARLNDLALRVSRIEEQDVNELREKIKAQSERTHTFVFLGVVPMVCCIISCLAVVMHG